MVLKRSSRPAAQHDGAEQRGVDRDEAAVEVDDERWCATIRPATRGCFVQPLDRRAPGNACQCEQPSASLPPPPSDARRLPCSTRRLDLVF